MRAGRTGLTHGVERIAREVTNPGGAKRVFVFVSMAPTPQPHVDSQNPVTLWASYERAEAARASVTLKLETSGIPTLPVKGIVTSCVLYEDVIQRPLNDVDLRIRAADFPRTLGVCKKQGWPIARIQRSYRNIVLRVAGVEVDIEGQIGPPGVCTLPVDALLARSTVAQRKGGPIRIPEIHDHAVVLCVNVYKDKMGAAFPWALEDLARIVRHDSFDVAEFRWRVEKAGIRTLAWIVADWFVDQRGDDVWARIRSVLGPRPPRPLYAWLVRRLLEGRSNALALRLLTRCSADDVVERARALAVLGVWAVEHRFRRG